MSGTKEMMEIKGIVMTTVAAFYAETGDLDRYTHLQQLINLAGLSLKEHS